MGDNSDYFWQSYSLPNDMQTRRVFLHSFNQAFVRVDLASGNALEGWLEANSKDNGEFHINGIGKERIPVPYESDFSLRINRGVYDFKRNIVPKLFAEK